MRRLVGPQSSLGRQTFAPSLTTAGIEQGQVGDAGMRAGSGTHCPDRGWLECIVQ